MDRLLAFITIMIFASSICMAQYEELSTVDKFIFRSFELEGKPIKKKEVARFLSRTCPSALNVYKTNRKKELLCRGLGIVGVGLLCLEIDNFYNGQFGAGSAVGLGLVGGSILLDFSYRKGYKRTVSTYEINCRQQEPLTLNFGVTQTNNLGILLNF